MSEEQAKAPTYETYEAFQVAYDFYNQELFGGTLPNCVITMMRKKSMLGYFKDNCWEDVEDKERTDEICMNPQAFNTRPVDDTLSTLVHEMCHLWQHHYGQKQAKSKNYHNREWADMMEEVGLMPSATGEPGGKTTGSKMDHYILPDGNFIAATRTLLDQEGWMLPYVSIDLEDSQKKAKKESKTKFVCPTCDEKIWGKPTTTAICEVCNVRFEPEVPDEVIEKLEELEKEEA